MNLNQMYDISIMIDGLYNWTHGFYYQYPKFK